MQPTDRAEFVRTLNGLAAIKGKELTAEALGLWWSAMAKWSIDDFKGAASHLVGSCQFMPSPYDFEQLKRAAEPTSSEAWLTVLHGYPLRPGSREARAAAVVGGQYNIRMANVERELPHLARRFKEAYEELSDVESVREALPQINRAALKNLTGLLPEFGK